jgi:hypothetical protein
MRQYPSSKDMKNTGRRTYIIGIHGLVAPGEVTEDIMCTAVLLLVKYVNL